MQGGALNTQYKLTVVNSWPEHSLVISAAEFEKIGKAVEGLTDIFWIEEIYDAVTQNYRAYEEGQILLALGHAMGTGRGFDAMDDARRTSGVHLDNLLSSARAFVDAVPQRLRVIGGQVLADAFRASTSRVYDASRAYRFMDALRNYTQHSGSSISGMTYDGRRVPSQTEPLDFKLTYSVRPSLHVDQVEQDFKAKIRPLLHDLKDDKGQIDITPLVREYMVGLNAIMLEARTLIAPTETTFRAIIDSAHARLKADGDARLPAVVKTEGDEEVAIYFLPDNQRERTERLRSRNGNLSHLSRVQLIS